MEAKKWLSPFLLALPVHIEEQRTGHKWESHARLNPYNHNEFDFGPGTSRAPGRLIEAFFLSVSEGEGRAPRNVKLHSALLCGRSVGSVSLWSQSRTRALPLPLLNSDDAVLLLRAAPQQP